MAPKGFAYLWATAASRLYLLLMKKKLIAIVAIFFAIAIFLVGSFHYMKSSTKKHSPEQRHTYAIDDLEIDIFYNSPMARDRKIFGELVPYGEVWRTGANEPSTITFNREVKVAGQTIAPGTYTIWTIPRQGEWEIMLNSGQYSWGVGWGSKAARDKALDVASVKVPAVATGKYAEQFTMTVEDDPLSLVLEWEETRVAVPLDR